MPRSFATQRASWAGEYDILAVNGSKVVVIEAKNKMWQDDLEYCTEIRLPARRDNFPSYAEKEICGGLGALVFKGHIEEMALKEGLFVFTQQQGGAGFIQAPDEPRAF